MHCIKVDKVNILSEVIWKSFKPFSPLKKTGTSLCGQLQDQSHLKVLGEKNNYSMIPK